ncbi:11700_t:CDS:2 [Acaulospora colombiana]|uniref:11700_t:CDS:1 n=1 Tax=Acaulospora colombiana TaxID=27376 RepID=A0ACA9KJ44_9GLOM|nr:11700_t:CDS:2 [Acaulospora colombiana]
MPYLTYHDADIDEEAVLLFNDGCWLNDKCIDLYLESVIYVPSLPTERILILFDLPHQRYLTHTVTPEAPQFNSASIVLAVINNNPDTTVAQGGTHWSLMIYVRDTNTCFHYDSASGMNTGVAKKVAKRLFGVERVFNKEAPQQRDEHIYRKLVKYEEESKFSPSNGEEPKYQKELFEVEFDEIPGGDAMRRKCKEIIAVLKREYDIGKGKLTGGRLKGS